LIISESAHYKCNDDDDDDDYRPVFTAGEGSGTLLQLRSTLLIREMVGSVWGVLLRRLWR